MSMITAAQIRSARNAVKMSVSELAVNSGVSTSTIKRIEAGTTLPKSTKANILAIKSALEAAGIEFIGTPGDGPGIRIHTKLVT